MKSQRDQTKKTGGWHAYAAGAGACVLLAAGAYFGGLEPALARREKTLADRAEYETRVTRVSDLSRDLQTARRQLDETKREIAGLPLKLEPASAVNQRLARIAELAGDSGLALDEVQPGTTSDGAYYQTVPLRLAGSGTYPACATFLHGLRTRFPDMAVRAFDCSANGVRGDKQTTASFRADIAWFTTLPRK